MKKLLFFFVSIGLLYSGSVWAKTDQEQYRDEVDNSIVIDRISNDDIQVTIPSVLFSFSDAEIRIKFKNPQHTKLLLNKNKVEFIINGEPQMLEFVNGEASFKHRFDTSKTLSIYAEDFSFNQNLTVYPMWAFFIPIILILLLIARRFMKK
jgi:hypothetical protein